MKKFLLLPLMLTAIFGACMAGARSSGLEELIQVYRERQEQATPASVISWLKAGNARFVAGRSNHGGFTADARERVQVASTGQRPLAAVLSCIDSRTSPEHAFDVSVGDLFTARVGANVISEDILGSLEVAVESGAKVVVVLGHTQCGGVMAACNGVELGHLTQLLEKVKPAIGSVQARMDHDPAYAIEVGERVTSNRRYVAEVSHANARQSRAQILTRSELLRKRAGKGEILVVSAMFDVFTGEVRFDQ